MAWSVEDGVEEASELRGSSRFPSGDSDSGWSSNPAAVETG